MKLTVCENYEEMSKKAADMIEKQLLLKKDSVLGLATGSTPVGLYEELVRRYDAGRIDFSTVKSFNLDEYLPILPTDKNSYLYFMKEHLFDHVNIGKDAYRVPDGNLPLEIAEANSHLYDDEIERAGGIDLQVLGVGHNGHIGFNEPAEALEVATHVVDLTEDTLKVNSRFFGSVETMPKKAVTMGLGSIFAAKKIVVLANGSMKHAAIAALRLGKVMNSCPVTFLLLHPDVTVICDREAYYG